VIQLWQGEVEPSDKAGSDYRGRVIYSSRRTMWSRKEEDIGGDL